MRSVALAAAVLGLLTLLPRASSGQMGVVPRWVRSIEVVRPGANLRTAPSRRAARRGTVQVGTRLPILDRELGEGCPGGGWIQVGPEAFICESLTRYSPEPPAGDVLPRVPEGALTPRDHAFVRTDGTWAYRRPTDYFRDLWVETLGSGFGVAIVGRQAVGGTDFAQTLGGLWVPVGELAFARPSDFVGRSLEPGADLSRIGWTVQRRVPVRERARGRVIDRMGRLLPVEVAEWGARTVTLADGRVLPRNAVTGPRRSAPPEQLTPGARWIDVDTETQTLVAYAGERPVYTTLVSTGRRPHDTRRGTFRIWVKLAESDMDDLERIDVSENYAIQAVPWVQFFDRSIGFHAAFWHDRFGHVRSHGCVNLSPSDARALFAFTEPSLPAGWDAILPTDADPGTLVRVR